MRRQLGALFLFCIIDTLGFGILVPLVPYMADRFGVAPAFITPILGSIATDIDKITTELKKELSPGNTIQVTGQIQSMNDAFRDMGIGLLFAAVFVYLLMVVNY